MTREELLARLAGLRQARAGGRRAPHKPLLLLWLFGRFAALGNSTASYQQAEAPVSQLINEFGPPAASPSAGRQRAAMPFVHLERELWELRDVSGQELGPDVPERRAWLLERGAVGRLRPAVEALLADPATLAAAARLLLDRHFTPTLAELICAAVGLDLAELDFASSAAGMAVPGRQRRPGFSEEVLRAYAYQCAMCGFDGAMDRQPVGIQAAHVRTPTAAVAARTVSSAAAKVTSAATMMTTAATKATSSAKTMSTALQAMNTATKAMASATKALTAAAKTMSAARPASARASSARSAASRNSSSGTTASRAKGAAKPRTPAKPRVARPGSAAKPASRTAAKPRPASAKPRPASAKPRPASVSRASRPGTSAHRSPAISRSIPPVGGSSPARTPGHRDYGVLAGLIH